MLIVGSMDKLYETPLRAIRRAVQKGTLKKCNRPGKLLFHQSDIKKWLGY
tara:strand:+ start:53 stop:202 length:150 start_codon:yes stop_codon:yes gene_type:complete